MTQIRAKNWNYPKQVVARISVAVSGLEIGSEETLRTGKVYVPSCDAIRLKRNGLPVTSRVEPLEATSGALTGDSETRLQGLG